MRGVFAYYRGSVLLSLAGLGLGALLGYHDHRSWPGALGTVFVVAVLSVLEISLSFDNAVVNATVLRQMTPLWRQRFLTWGIAIAVFGMRLVFPLLVVSVAAGIGPLAALQLAAFAPAEYARIMTGTHVALGAFGGAFLGMVCLKYFFDAEKHVHWIEVVETRLTRLGRIEAFEIGVLLVGLYLVSRQLPEEQRQAFLVAGIFGLVTYIVVDGVSALAEVDPGKVTSLHRASAGMFLYLEVLDASFSFDGVIGAFALTNNLFVIAIGLGVGAMFVRSMTIMLVDRGTLASYRYLEHGAFYAIGALALLMLYGTVREIPEAVTGLIGAACIGLSLWSSVRFNRRHGGAAVRAEGSGASTTGASLSGQAGAAASQQDAASSDYNERR